MGGRTPQEEREIREALRGVRSLLMIAILTIGSAYFLTNCTLPVSRAHGFWSSFAVGIRVILRGAFSPHGNPLVYSLAISWLVAITIATLSSAIFFRVNPKLFSLAHWEKQGTIYDRAGVRAFRWVLFHSPLGWINPTFHLRANRTDCERLLREMNSGEAVHWLTCVVSVMLAISYFLHDHAVYSYGHAARQNSFRPVSHHAAALESRSCVASVGTSGAYRSEHLLNPRHPRILRSRTFRTRALRLLRVFIPGFNSRAFNIFLTPRKFNPPTFYAPVCRSTTGQIN